MTPITVDVAMATMVLEEIPPELLLLADPLDELLLAAALADALDELDEEVDEEVLLAEEDMLVQRLKQI